MTTWATFHLADELLALRVEDVQEVLMPQPLTQVPLAPAHVVGLLNLRGQILTAVDLRRRLGFQPGEREAENLVVVRGEEQLVALLVDSIGDVVDLPDEGWRQPPDTLSTAHRPYVHGICPLGPGQLLLGLRTEVVTSDQGVP